MTNVNQDNQNSEGSPDANSGSAAKLPLRGLAMVLIAVAVLLALWGLYAMTRDDSTDTSSGLAEESDVISTTPASTAPGDTPEGTEPAQTPTPVDTDNSDDTGDRENTDGPEGTRDAEGADDADSDTDDAAGTANAAQAAKPATTEDKAPARLNVLNNSTVPNLAAEVASTLKDDGYDVGEVGNLATQILSENTVYFQPGNKDAEQRARKMADKVDGVAREYDSQLPAETDGSNDITLVLVRQVAL